MKISARIQKFLDQQHYVTIKDLQQFSINVIYEQMMAYQKFNCQIVCSFSAIDVYNNKIVVGTHILADILKMKPQKKIKIQQIRPLGIFNSNLTFKQFIQAYHNQQKQKPNIQPILKRKLVSRVNIISKNNQFKNKRSQQNLQNNNKKNQTKVLNNNTKNKKKLQYQVNKNEKANQINSNNFLQKITNNSQLASQTYQSKRSNLKLISTQSQSDDEKKLLNQFNIDLNKNIESQNPIIHLKNQLNQMNGEIDQDQQYQLFLKAQKIKAQNKNFNVPDKVFKNSVALKTQQKIGINLKSATQNPLKQKKMLMTTTQPTLFSFVSKK